MTEMDESLLVHTSALAPFAVADGIDIVCVIAHRTHIREIRQSGHDRDGQTGAKVGEIPVARIKASQTVMRARANTIAFTTNTMPCL